MALAMSVSPSGESTVRTACIQGDAESQNQDMNEFPDRLPVHRATAALAAEPVELENNQQAYAAASASKDRVSTFHHAMKAWSSWNTGQPATANKCRCMLLPHSAWIFQKQTHPKHSSTKRSTSNSAWSKRTSLALWSCARSLSAP